MSSTELQYDSAQKTSYQHRGYFTQTHTTQVCKITKKQKHATHVAIQISNTHTHTTQVKYPPCGQLVFRVESYWSSFGTGKLPYMGCLLSALICVLQRFLGHILNCTHGPYEAVVSHHWQFGNKRATKHIPQIPLRGFTVGKGQASTARAACVFSSISKTRSSAWTPNVDLKTAEIAQVVLKQSAFHFVSPGIHLPPPSHLRASLLSCSLPI